MITYTVPADPAAVAPELADLYAKVFGEPPYTEGPEHVADFTNNYQRSITMPGFAVVVARDASGTLVGFAWGRTGPAGWWWGGCDIEPPPEVRAAEKWILFEWAVLAQYRGQGVGRTLITHVLKDRPEPWSTLCTHPDADAYRLYVRAGWQPISPCRREGWPPMVAMLLRLPGAGT